MENEIKKESEGESSIEEEDRHVVLEGGVCDGRGSGGVKRGHMVREDPIVVKDPTVLEEYAMVEEHVVVEDPMAAKEPRAWE